MGFATHRNPNHREDEPANPHCPSCRHHPAEDKNRMMVKGMRLDERIAARRSGQEEVPHVRRQCQLRAPPSTAGATPRDVAHQVTHVAL